MHVAKSCQIAGMLLGVLFTTGCGDIRGLLGHQDVELSEYEPWNDCRSKTVKPVSTLADPKCPGALRLDIVERVAIIDRQLSLLFYHLSDGKKVLLKEIIYETGTTSPIYRKLQCAAVPEEELPPKRTAYRCSLPWLTEKDENLKFHLHSRTVTPEGCTSSATFRAVYEKSYCAKNYSSYDPEVVLNKSIVPKLSPEKSSNGGSL